MNNLSWDETIPRVRNKSLLIVEGNHEKNKLFWLLFNIFPEININMDDVWIYGTNIYMLYDDIKAEYGDDWDELDVDLPYVISKKKNFEKIQFKNDYTNIIIVFDYEHQDTNFAEDKILRMQRYFIDSTDVGKLYINYPMIESYQDLFTLPDRTYAERKIPVTLQRGAEYKNLVKDTMIAKQVMLPHKMKDILKERSDILEESKYDKCIEQLLEITVSDGLDKKIKDILENVVRESYLLTTTYQFKDLILRSGFTDKKMTYWKYMRELFTEIIFHNICKANKIQMDKYEIECSKYREVFENIDFLKILQKQNMVSCDLQEGFIWVLNTCVLFIPEYNFNLIV